MLLGIGMFRNCLFVELLQRGLLSASDGGSSPAFGFWVTSLVSGKPAACLFSTKEVNSLKPLETPRSSRSYM